jgi:hypothetical protein
MSMSIEKPFPLCVTSPTSGVTVHTRREKSFRVRVTSPTSPLSKIEGNNPYIFISESF